MNDYIIAVDRDGQPYIAHAWGQRGANANHKYIAKIGEGAKARYFYTQEQLRAFQQGARQGAQNAKVGLQKTGNQLRTGANSLGSKLNGQSNGRNQKEQRSVSRAEQAAAKIKMNTHNAVANADKAIRKTAEKVGDAGYDASQKVKKGVDKTVSKVKANQYKKEVQKLQREADDIKNRKGATIEAKNQAQIAANNARIKQLNEELKYQKTDRSNKEAAVDTIVKNNNKLLKEISEEKKSSAKTAKPETKSKFSEYTKGDKDFDDKNFDEKNRVGDSDFFMAKRPDGSTVILEEDMKWVLPKGVNPNDPAIKRALTKEYKAGSNEEWVKQVTEAIDDAVEEANKKK